MVVIGVVGYKSAGKDTFAEYMQTKRVYVKYAFATPLKKACQTLFLLSEQQLHDPIEKEVIDSRWNLSPRQMFQFLGTDVMRNQIHSDFWLQHFLHWYQNHKEQDIIVTDVRFQNEVDIIKQCGGIIIRINRQISQDDHVSERGISELHGIDYVIENTSSLEDYHHRIDDFFLNVCSSSSMKFEEIVDRTNR